MSDGSEFRVCGAATEYARRANSVRVLAADSSGVSEDRTGRTGIVTQRTGSGRLNKKTQGGGRRDHVSAIPCSRRSSSSYNNVNVHTINSALRPSRVAKSSTSFGWGKGRNVTTAGWQVTLHDPIWHVDSSSGMATSVSELLYTCYFTLLYPHKITALFL